MIPELEGRLNGFAVRVPIPAGSFVDLTDVEEFKPDRILIALRSPDHANWQERKLIAHVEQRFGAPSRRTR